VIYDKKGNDSSFAIKKPIPEVRELTKKNEKKMFWELRKWQAC
jgi:hypothetical protein